MSKYAQLTEHNDHEGETWHFYIPIDGNEAVLDQLDTALGALGDRLEEDVFELELAPIPEMEVDILVKRGGDTDYMAEHNKLAGRLVLTDEHLAKLAAGDIDPLYKGRIRDHMKAAES